MDVGRIVAEVERRWAHAARTCGLGHKRATARFAPGKQVESLPTISRPTVPADGVIRWQLQAADGQTLDDIASAADELAATLRLLRVRVEPHSAGVGWSAKNGALNALWCETLPDRLDWRPPRDGRPHRSLTWTVAVDELGRPVRHRHARCNQLVIGATRSGKTSLMNVETAEAALSSHVVIAGVDPKRVDLRRWSGRLNSEAYEPRDTNRLLSAVLREIERRQEWFDAHGLVDWPGASAELPAVLLRVDEAHDLFASKAFKGADEQVAEIARKGLGLGVQIVMAIQSANAEIVPTSIRNNFGWRWLSSCEGPGPVESAVGDKSRVSQAPAWRLPARQGLGYLISVDEPGIVLTKSGWIDPGRTIPAVVRCTQHLMAPYELGLGPQQLVRGRGPVVDAQSVESPDPTVGEALRVVARAAGVEPGSICDAASLAAAIDRAAAGKTPLKVWGDAAGLLVDHFGG